VNEQAQEAKGIVDWYRENIGDPNDVVEFKQWKAEQIQKAKADEAKGKISPEKLAQIRQLMREADPAYAKFIDKQEREEEERMDGQFDDAADRVRELCQQAGYPTEEKISARIGAHVIDEIKADKKLMQMWQRGNLKCIDIGFKRYCDEFLTPMSKTNGKSDRGLADLRKISRLPALPQGGSAAGSKPPARKPEDRGITKQAHEDAWEVMQSHMRD
jgi:hypothetical protein